MQRNRLADVRCQFVKGGGLGNDRQVQAFSDILPITAEYSDLNSSFHLASRLSHNSITCVAAHRRGSLQYWNDNSQARPAQIGGGATGSTGQGRTAEHPVYPFRRSQLSVSWH